MQLQLLSGETIVKRGKANRTTLLNAQGGELVLTSRRIVFLDHGLNVGNGTTEIPMDQIMAYGKANTFTIFFPIPIPNAF
jgi:hypothetical protein